MSRTAVKQWFQRPLRIGALQCNFEGGRAGTMAVIDKWRGMGMNVEQLLHPCADGYSALFDARRHGSILRAYLARARRRGLRVILYLNVHIIGPSEAGRRADWAQRRADGTWPMLYDDTYYATCYNSLWRRRFFAALEALADFPIDGIFLDGPSIVPGGCHCLFCRARHQEWFGVPMGEGATSFDFNWRTLESFLFETYRRFKAIHPQGIVYQNLGVEHARASFLDIRRVLQCNDIVATEGGFMFYRPPGESWVWRPGFEARLLEALAPNKPRVIFMAGDQKPWSWYMHQPAETTACIASCAANGASVWYGLHGASRLLNSPGGRAAARAFRFLRRHEEFFDGGESAADVAILYSYETDRALDQATAASDLYGQGAGSRSGAGLGDHKLAVKGFADMLIRGHVPFDLVTDLNLNAALLRRYRCLILPSAVCMSDGVAAAMDAYLAAGGHLLASFTTSLCDERGRPRRDFALARAFGARSLRHVTPYGNFNYMVARGRHALLKGLDIPCLPMGGEAMDVRAVAGGEVLLDFLKPLSGRYVPLTARGRPAALLRRRGRGECLYLAGAFGEQYMRFMAPEYRLLALNAVRRWSRPVVELRGGESPVEVVARRQPGRLVVHLTNGCSFDGRPLVRTEPRRDLRLFVRGAPASRPARALVGGLELPWRRVPRGGELVLPLLAAHETIVLPLSENKHEAN